MKILTVEQIRQADAYTIEHEFIKSIDLMERAANACVDWILANKKPSENIYKIFCGLGDNGGDGLAIARLLSDRKIQVHVFVIKHSDKYSDDFKLNEERLKNIPVTHIGSVEQINSIKLDKKDIVVDAIFGSGLNRSPSGIATDVINKINSSGCKVIAIDVPSGFSSAFAKESKLNVCIKADVTLKFQLPLLDFMLPQNEKHIGHFVILDIGLSREFIKSISTDYYFVTLDDIKKIIKPRAKFSHKGSFGHALIIAGSYGKMGAAVMCVKACMRTGAGLTTTHVPKSGYVIMQKTLPEAMVSIDSHEEFIGDNVKLEKYNAIGVGPGIDTNKQTQNMLKLLIQNSKLPLVIDADALNILSENKTWLSFIPKESILAPHPKEFERLTEKASDDYERLDLLRQFSIRFGVYVVLKGAHTTVACPDGKLFFNSTGNPGMAKGGSGDVLTGVITSLLAQSYRTDDSAIMGVYLHGLAGDIASHKQGEQSMLATDIIDNLGEAFSMLN